jgi:hypothetical protein
VNYWRDLVTLEWRTQRDGGGFDVTPYDFQVADAIWGPDIASLKGKTTKAKAMVPDSTLGVPVIQQQKTLVVDIMFNDEVSTLVEWTRISPSG